MKAYLFTLLLLCPFVIYASADSVTFYKYNAGKDSFVRLQERVSELITQGDSAVLFSLPPEQAETFIDIMRTAIPRKFRKEKVSKILAVGNLVRNGEARPFALLTGMGICYFLDLKKKRISRITFDPLGMLVAIFNLHKESKEWLRGAVYTY